jgi:uncharacterized protein
MKSQTNNLHLNVGFVAQESIGYSREFLFERSTLFLEPDLLLHDFKGKITASRTSEGLLFQGEFRAISGVNCVRCLVDYDQILETEYTELYVFESHVQADTELVYPEDGHIDLGPVIREYMLIEMPINSVCREDCKGLCFECGNNLNDSDCKHEPDPVDPRLSVLKSLLDEE